MSNYPAYPYHQELGELEAICQLDEASQFRLGRLNFCIYYCSPFR